MSEQCFRVVDLNQVLGPKHYTLTCKLENKEVKTPLNDISSNDSSEDDESNVENNKVIGLGDVKIFTSRCYDASMFAYLHMISLLILKEKSVSSVRDNFQITTKENNIIIK